MPSEENPRTGTHTAGHAQRGKVVQPTLPLIQLSNTLTAAQRDTVIASSQNQHLNDLNERINFLQTGKRDSKLTYDTKADRQPRPITPITPGGRARRVRPVARYAGNVATVLP